jgi:hypothetical protein
MIFGSLQSELKREKQMHCFYRFTFPLQLFSTAEKFVTRQLHKMSQKIHTNLNLTIISLVHLNERSPYIIFLHFNNVAFLPLPTPACQPS